MGMYQIKDVEHLSGIKAHTLRIWEKRYNIIEPKRTDTNIRYYDDNDLKRILNISILNKNGYKISKIADFNDSRLNSEILTLSSDTENLDMQIGNLIKAMIDFDKILFEKIFSQSIMHKGFQETILKLIYPFFKRVGILWLTENIDPAQEHFISNIIRQKVIVAIDGLPEYNHNYAENFVLYLPDGQWHEMGLLMSSYLIKKNGHNYIYLGSSLPIDSVVKMKESISFNYIITTASIAISEEDMKQEFISLANKFPDKTIFVGGLQNESIQKDLPKNIFLMNNLDEFNQYLKQLKKS
jgi:DNA-binding transcriptional MerR regulator